RKTVAAAVRVEGIGVFTGADTACEIHPAAAGQGLKIARYDDEAFPLTAEHLTTKPVHPLFGQIPPRHTSVARSPDESPIFTVEHLTAALVGLGITDATVRVRGPELPIGDGSAKLFVDPILARGIVELDAEMPFMRLAEPMRFEEGPASIVIEPSDRVHIEYRLDYGDPRIPAQSAAWDGTPETFAREIAPARTFSLQEEAQQLQAAGLFTRFSARDLLVLGEDGPIDNELRYPDEPARHKLLDLIGDLHLCGGCAYVNVTATKSGHALNQQAARALRALHA
ncbi:MAG: UDP-3-O-acyl-N-acetylglucosamine deacetylase, partial [Planctomycetota bacterium]